LRRYVGGATRGQPGRLGPPLFVFKPRDCSRMPAAFANRDRLGFLAGRSGPASIHISRAKNFIHPQSPATMERCGGQGRMAIAGDPRGQGCDEQKACKGDAWRLRAAVVWWRRQAGGGRGRGRRCRVDLLVERRVGGRSGTGLRAVGSRPVRLDSEPATLGPRESKSGTRFAPHAGRLAMRDFARAHAIAVRIAGTTPGHGRRPGDQRVPGFQ